MLCKCVLLLLSLLPCLSSFLFSDTPYCYMRELEDCLRDAMIAASGHYSHGRVHRSIQSNGSIGGKNRSSIPSSAFEKRTAIIVVERKSIPPQTLLRCRDARRIATCFNIAGCTLETAAETAASTYHRLFGEELPSQLFMAYWGSGRMKCELSCSAKTIKNCEEEVKKSGDSERDSDMMEKAERLSEKISTSFDVKEDCEAFKAIIIQLMRIRSDRCEEGSTCLCLEESLRKGVNYCKIGCENVLSDSQPFISSSYTFSSYISYALYPLLLSLLCLRY